MRFFAKQAAFAGLLFSICGSACASSFLSTLAWVNQQSLGTPQGFDCDPYGNTIGFMANYDGSATSCNVVNLGLGDTEWGSSTISFTGLATASFCKFAPNYNCFGVGTYDDYGDSLPQALYLAQFNNLGGFISSTSFYVPNQTAQIPIGLDADSSSNALIAIQASDTTHSSPFLQLLAVKPDYSIKDYDTTDYSINPGVATHRPDRWYITGQDNNPPTDAGGAKWVVYDDTGTLIASGTKANQFLDGAGDEVKYFFLIAPAPNNSFLVIQDAVYNFVSAPTRENTSHVAMLYDAKGDLVSTSKASNGFVWSAVNQGSGVPTYFWEYDYGTGSSSGTPVLYQFTDYHLAFKWDRVGYSLKILPDSTGVFTVGTDTKDAAVYVYRYDLNGNLLWHQSFAGSKSGGTNYPVGAALESSSYYGQRLCLFSSLQNSLFTVADWRQFVTGVAMQSVSGPSSVKSGQTFTITIPLNGPSPSGFEVSLSTSADLTIDNSHSVADYPSTGQTSVSITVQAGTVTKNTGEWIKVSDQHFVLRNYAVTLTP